MKSFTNFKIGTLCLLIVFVTITSAIPGDQRVPSGSIRQKRGGWGYENVAVSTVPAAGTTAILTSPGLAQTSVVVPHQTVIVGRTGSVGIASVPIVPHTESYVWQTAPSYSYQLHQRHPQYVYTSYYPTFSSGWGW